MLLRRLLAGGRRRVADRFQGPQIAMAMMRLNRFSVRRKADAIQRRTILPFCQ
jgi:hypothetical protein